MSEYYKKYIKYKQKYLKLRSQKGGYKCLKYGFQQHTGECWHDALGMLIMQSDLTSEDFINNIKILDVEERYYELKDMFSPQNIDKNAYLLPQEFYLYYIENKDLQNNNIDKIISEFLNLSKEYISNHKDRVINRLENDDELKRYYAYLSTNAYINQVNQIKKDIKKYILNLKNKQKDVPEIIIPNEEELIEKHLKELRENYKLELRKTSFLLKKKRRLSASKSILCANYIIEIDNILVANKQYKHKLNEGKLIKHNILAYEILILYIIRKTKPHIYLEFDEIPIINNFDFKQYKNALRLLDDKNLIGINMFVGIDDPLGDHLISLYYCNETPLLYDDNNYGSSYINWKESLKDKIELILNGNDPNIGYNMYRYALQKYGFDDFRNDYDKKKDIIQNSEDIKMKAISQALKYIDSIKKQENMNNRFKYENDDDLSIEQKIDKINKLYERLVNIIKLINPKSHILSNLFNPPIIENILKTITLNVYPITSLLFITYNEFNKIDTECEYIIKMLNNDKISNIYKKTLLNRLCFIKNINKDNAIEKILELIKQYYEIIDVKLLVHFMIKFNFKEQELKYIIHNLLNLVPDIIYNDTFMEYINNYYYYKDDYMNDISLYFDIIVIIVLFYMNNEKSEIILETYDYDVMNDLIRDLIYKKENNEIINFYNININKYEKKTIYDIIKFYKKNKTIIDNKTNSEIKAQLIEIMK